MPRACLHRRKHENAHAHRGRRRFYYMIERLVYQNAFCLVLPSFISCIPLGRDLACTRDFAPILEASQTV